MQAPLATEGRPSGQLCLANQLITLTLLPKAADHRQFNSIQFGKMLLGEKVKAALPLRASTLKQQAMIMQQSRKWQARLKPALPITYVN